jgi:cytochrome c556
MKRLILIVTGTLAVVGCGSTKSVVLHEVMTQDVATNAQVIWDVTNDTLGDDGSPIISKMKPGDWEKLKVANAKLKASLLSLTTAHRIIVATPGDKILDEDEPTGVKPATVQKNLDANPEIFRDRAQSVISLTEKMGQSIDRRDLKATYESAGELDGACESCHQPIWFGKKPA